MNAFVKKRVLEIGEYVARTGATVRETAKVFQLSKSTVHAYLTNRLGALDEELHQRVQKRLSYNLSVRHVRGGEATKRKFKNKKRSAI